MSELEIIKIYTEGISTILKHLENEVSKLDSDVEARYTEFIEGYEACRGDVENLLEITKNTVGVFATSFDSRQAKNA